MNKLIFLFSFFLLFNCQGESTLPPTTPSPGAAQTDKYLPALEGKRVGLVVNQTSTIDTTHLVDMLVAQQVNVKRVFAPEHGFRGKADAGEQVKDGVDMATGIPIISLYGSNKKPSSEQLSDLDVVVFDIQDVGTRFYTYISTMHYVMEACAENNKPLIILDRPNPNGMYVDGPVLDTAYQSFVGMHPIPILHGLTVGELAMMINGQGWLNGGLKADIEVVKVKNYTHATPYSLPVKPSPNLPNDVSIKLYPSLCLFEGTVISVGRGTQQPFQQIGHPELEALDHTFKPESIEGMSKYPKYEGMTCHGIAFGDSEAGGFTLKYLINFYNRYNQKDEFFNTFFDKLAGNSVLREQIKAGYTEDEIRATWKLALDEYRKTRQKYLLYPEQG